MYNSSLESARFLWQIENMFVIHFAKHRNLRLLFQELSRHCSFATISISKRDYKYLWYSLHPIFLLASMIVHSDQSCQTFRISRKISGFFRFPNIFYMTNYVSVVHLYFRKFKWFYRGSALSSIGLQKDINRFFYVLLYGKTSLLWTSSGLFKSVHYSEVFTSRGFTA
jgi:hypothetical protein